MGLIYLIRHAKPVLSGVLLGSTDVPLAVAGLTPFEKPVDRVYCSPLQRAFRTAELLFPGREIATIAAFSERGLGEWETLAWAEVEERWPEAAARASADWFAHPPPGGEPWEAFRHRVRSAWDQLPRNGVTAIVAHAGVNSLLWHFATGNSPLLFQQDYCEVLPIVLSDSHSANGQ